MVVVVAQWPASTLHGFSSQRLCAKLIACAVWSKAAPQLLMPEQQRRRRYKYRGDFGVLQDGKLTVEAFTRRYRTRSIKKCVGGVDAQSCFLGPAGGGCGAVRSCGGKWEREGVQSCQIVRRQGADPVSSACRRLVSSTTTRLSSRHCLIYQNVFLIQGRLRNA